MCVCVAGASGASAQHPCKTNLISTFCCREIICVTALESRGGRVRGGGGIKSNLPFVTNSILHMLACARELHVCTCYSVWIPQRGALNVFIHTPKLPPITCLAAAGNECHPSSIRALFALQLKSLSSIWEWVGVFFSLLFLLFLRFQFTILQGWCHAPRAVAEERKMELLHACKRG